MMKFEFIFGVGLNLGLEVFLLIGGFDFGLGFDFGF